MNIKNSILILVCFFLYFVSIDSVSAQNGYRHHIVEQGETVYSIAKKHNISSQDIYNINPGSEKSIKINQVLLIPAIFPKTEENPYFIHSIQKDETLYSVSRHYGIPENEILAANEGLSHSNFKIGHAIRIPKQASAQSNVPLTSSSNKTHKVLPKETLYNISKQYNVTVEQIADANPSIKREGLKRDMTLVIPSSSNNVEKDNQKNETRTNTEPNLLYKMTTDQISGAIRVGLFLPFLDNQQQQQARFTEYYEGFLLAIEDLKTKGFSIDLYAFDIRKGRANAKLKSLLGTYEVKNLNMIIGGVSDEEIALLSEFTKENNIEYVIPFPTRKADIIKNPNTFQANVTPSLIYPKVIDIFLKQFRDYNIIILSEEKASLNDKLDFITLLKTNMSQAHIIPQNITISDGLNTDLKNALSTTKRNIIIPASSSLATLSKVMPAVRVLKNQDEFLALSLFGYPDWQTYSAQFLQDFYKYDTYIFSSFYANNNDSETQKFMERFRSWYNKVPINTYPKYALLGYDTGLYFLTALYQGQGRLTGNIPEKEIPTIQSIFYFNNNGLEGNINTGLYFVHYKNDMTIDKIDYSK